MPKLMIFTILISFFIPYQLVQGGQIPVIDGQIEENEWNESQTIIIRMDNGIDIRLSIIYSETDAYYLAEVPHNAPGDVIIRDPEAGQHDYFGIEFDNNNDGAIMGTRSNPDDLIMIDYDAWGAVDMFTHTFKVFKDTEFGGNNDVDGISGENDGGIFYEIRKSLSSFDRNGYDIGLEKGDKYYIMPAFWDNKNTGSAAGTVNIQVGNTLFLELTVDKISSQLQEEIITTIFILLSIGAVLLLYKSQSR